MNKAMLLKIVNPILFLLVVNQACTGLLSDSFSHDMFEILHEGGGIVLIIFSLIHLILNWGWVRSTFLKSKMNHN